jgi:UDP-N-acetyl-2-amino-2-deoxyglucuronate dehydrogenase
VISSIPAAEISVICDNYENAGRELASKTNAEYITDIDEAVNRQDVDIVSVCTPSGSHLDVALKAARAGKHLIVEKPIEITVERAEQIISEAKENGVKLTGIFPYRFLTGVNEVKKAIEDGRLGNIILANAYIKWYRDEDYYQSSNWKGTFIMDGGGALMNQGIHSVDLLQYLAGDVKQVFAWTRTLSHDIETEDTVVAALEFKNGFLGSIEASTACWPGESGKIELFGDKGSIILSDGRITSWKLSDADKNEEERMLDLEEDKGSGARSVSGFSIEMHFKQISDFIDAIDEDRLPIIPGYEALKSVEIIRAVYRSAKSGKSVNLK